MILLSKYNMLIMLACMKLPRVCINVVIFKNKNGLYMLRVCVCQSLCRVRLSLTPWTAACQPLCPWNSPGKNTGVGCHFLLQCEF